MKEKVTHIPYTSKKKEKKKKENQPPMLYMPWVYADKPFQTPYKLLRSLVHNDANTIPLSYPPTPPEPSKADHGHQAYQACGLVSNRMV